MNGVSTEYTNALGPGPGGSKLVFIKAYYDVDEFEFSFDFLSANDVDHLHMLVANGQATYLGDSVPLTKALSHLETGEMVYVCVCVYVCIYICVCMYVLVGK